MESLVLALSVQQTPGRQGSTVMAVGAAILLILAIRAFGRSLQPVYALVKAAAALGVAALCLVGALALVVLSLFL